MRIGRQIVSFAGGVAVGVCLLLLPKLWHQFRESSSKASPRAIVDQAHNFPTSRVARPPDHARVSESVRASSSEPPRVGARIVGERRPPARPAPETTKRAEPTEAKEVAPASGGKKAGQVQASAGRLTEDSPDPPAPASFKPLGYVEKAGGRVEAIVSQDDHIYVVHAGELFADKYRVLKISPDSVEAVDETTVQAGLRLPAQAGRQVALNQPTSRVSKELSANAGQNPFLVAKLDAPGQPAARPPATQKEQLSTHQGATSATEPLGYVERADGRVETIMADGEHVRLVPQAAVVAVARRAPPSIVPDRASAASVSAGKIVPPALSSAQVADGSALPVEDPGTGLAPAIRAVSFQLPDRVPAPAYGRASNPPERGRAEQPAGRLKTGICPTGSCASIRTKNPTGPASVSTSPPILMRPIGFVEKAEGELDAILSLSDDVYVVRQGDCFAGRYRALRVSREAVEAVEELPHDGLSPPRLRRQAVPQPPALPDLFSVAIRDGPSPPLAGQVRPESQAEQVAAPPEAAPLDEAVWASIPPSVREDRRKRRKPAKSPDRDRAKAADKVPVSPEPATFVFQALGYVETAKGEVQAIVVDGAQVYLVRQGDTFADQYRAVSVDPAMVLAVRAPPGEEGKNSLFSRTGPGTLASNKVFGVLRLPPSGVADVGLLQDKGALGGSGLTDVGVNLFGSPGFAGFDLQSHLMMADNRNVSF